MVAQKMETQETLIETHQEKLTGKDLILATKPYAQEDRSRSWAATLSTLVLLLSSIAGIYLVEWLPLKIAFSILTGLLIVRMFVLYHDHQHHAILHRSPVANVIMTLFGIFVLAPTSIWKRSHDYHHKHNSKLFSASIGSFPIATKSKYLSMSPGERRMYLFTRHPLTISFGYIFMFIIGMCVNSFTKNPKKHIDSLIALILHIGFSVLIFATLGWQAWLLGIYVPFMIACGIGSYLFYAQHNFPSVTFKDNKDWKYEISALESSSYMKMSPFMQWVTANIGFHHIHHLNARIPFYKLPEAMAAIPELQQAGTTSLKPREIAACLRLKVWDPQRNRMIGFRELREDLRG